MIAGATSETASMKDAERLADALGISLREARLEMDLLLMRALGVGRARLIAHPELAAQAQSHAQYRQDLERRASGEPIAYILGEREFYGLCFQVTPAVLIPRPETELLVDLTLERIAPDASAQVLEIGTGSGCIAVAVARLRRQARIVATDVSEAALAVARANAARHHADRIEYRCGDCFAPVPAEQFDVIVSNPPYIAAGDPHLSEGDLRFEPEQALTSGVDGLALIRRIIREAPRRLRQGGWLLLEHGHDQGDAVEELLLGNGFTDVLRVRDLAGMPRIAGGRLMRAVD
jgi:release factor glutamine methyltransferase